MSKYPSIAAMQADLEEIDVANNEYEAWDAKGVPLALSMQKRMWLKVEPQGLARPEDLAVAINQFAQLSGLSADRSLLSLGRFDEALDKIEQQLNARGKDRSWLRRLWRAK